MNEGVRVLTLDYLFVKLVKFYFIFEYKMEVHEYFARSFLPTLHCTLFRLNIRKHFLLTALHFLLTALFHLGPMPPYFILEQYA